MWRKIIKCESNEYIPYYLFSLAVIINSVCQIEFCFIRVKIEENTFHFLVLSCRQCAFCSCTDQILSRSFALMMLLMVSLSALVQSSLILLFLFRNNYYYICAHYHLNKLYSLFQKLMSQKRIYLIFILKRIK